ncbi:hypothetical protein L218DRAFT_628218 [Marasmius fiardii PR-910]|nr:hypothetical protein L218DRAFT_628218 [Marasmius fiardii PR-910]
MPAHRRTITCANVEPYPKTVKFRVKVVLTKEEKEEKELEKMFNRAKGALKKQWEATLVPANRDERFRWPLNTQGLYKSEAKSLYKFTPKEIATLRAEHIACSHKSFVRLEDVTELARRKAEFLQREFKEILLDQIPNLREKFQDDGRRITTNWARTSSTRHTS